MGVASQIIESPFRIGRRHFGIDDPRCGPERIDPRVPIRIGGQRRGETVIPQAMTAAEGFQAGDKPGLKGCGQGLFPEQVMTVGATPSAVGGIPRATGNETMDMIVQE